MKSYPIEIDHDIFLLLKENMLSFNETPNEILRRLLLNKPSNPSTIIDISSDSSSDSWPYGGVSFPVGLQLKKRFKGKDYYAVITRNGILIDGLGLFESPSAAAMSIANNNVNGWVFWQYLDTRNNRWRVLSEIKK